MDVPKFSQYYPEGEVIWLKGVPHQLFTVSPGRIGLLPVQLPSDYVFQGSDPQDAARPSWQQSAQPLIGVVVEKSQPEKEVSKPRKRSWPDAFRAYLSAEGVSGARAVFVVATRLGFTSFTAFLAAIPGIGDDLATGGLGIVDDAPVAVVVAYYLYRVSRYRRIEE